MCIVFKYLTLFLKKHIISYELVKTVINNQVFILQNFEATFTITITTAIDVNCSVVFNVNISSNELILDNVSPLWQHM